MSQQTAFGIAADLIEKGPNTQEHVSVHDILPLATGYLRLFSDIKRVLELKSSVDRHQLVNNLQAREILEKALYGEQRT